MSNFLKNFWLKIIDRQKYNELKILKVIDSNKKKFHNSFENQINNIQKKIDTNDTLNFLHSGHAADIINVLPVIKELSKNHKCNLYITIDKPLNKYYHKHPAGDVFLNIKIYNMLEPLLKKQNYITKVNKFNNEKIDINFDIIREIPINLLFDNTKYSFVVTGIFPDLSLPFLESESHNVIKNKIIIQRTFRYRNPFINYKFLNNYENLLFVGTKEEYDDMKLDVKKLEFYDCKDFLEMAGIIKSSKFTIGNSSIAFPIAEGLKVPRLLEACPHFPAAQPHGKNAFDFYFQSHFEKWFKYLYYFKSNMN
tara:strand:- start:1463 stop:2389 length:927 start_codon:yes stop_codon:yes gene_type:complete